MIQISLPCYTLLKSPPQLEDAMSAGWLTWRCDPVFRWWMDLDHLLHQLQSNTADGDLRHSANLGGLSIVKPHGGLYEGQNYFWAQNRCYSAPVKAMKDKTTLGRRIVVTPLPQSKRSQGQCNLNCLSYTLIRSSAREGWLWVLLLEPSPCRAHPWPSLASQGV